MAGSHDLCLTLASYPYNTVLRASLRRTPGCDPTNPICLYLNDPVANSTAYQLKFDAVLPAAQKTGAFRMVLWGQDQVRFRHLRALARPAGIRLSVC